MVRGRQVPARKVTPQSASVRDECWRNVWGDQVVKFGTPLSLAEMHNIRMECAKGIYYPDAEDGDSIPFFQRPMVIIFTAAISSMLFMWALLSAIM